MNLLIKDKRTVFKWIAFKSKGTLRVERCFCIPAAHDGVYAFSKDQRTARYIPKELIFDSKGEALDAANPDGVERWIVVAGAVGLTGRSAPRLFKGKVVTQPVGRTDVAQYALEKLHDATVSHRYFNAYPTKKEALTAVGENIERWRYRIARELDQLEKRVSEQSTILQDVDMLREECRRARVKIVKREA